MSMSSSDNEEGSTRSSADGDASSVIIKDPILVTDPTPEICDKDGLTRALKEISYGKPNNLERYPWLERLDYVSKTKLPDDLDPNADIERERLIYESSLKGTKEALLKLKYLGVKFARPKDFLAEMFKSDEHMAKLQSRIELQKVRIEKSTARRNNPQIKKTSKKKHSKRK